MNKHKSSWKSLEFSKRCLLAYLYLSAFLLLSGFLFLIAYDLVGHLI